MNWLLCKTHFTCVFVVVGITDIRKMSFTLATSTERHTTQTQRLSIVVVIMVAAAECSTVAAVHRLLRRNIFMKAVFSIVHDGW